MRPKKLLIVINNLDFLVSHRLPIALAAQKNGHEVHIAYGSLEQTELTDLTRQGLQLHYVPIDRGNTNPIADVKSLFLLWKLFRYLQPIVVHLVTIKPVLYGGIAARLARVPAVVFAMAGLGFVFIQSQGIKSALLRAIVKSLFGWALRHPNQKLIFQNQDDCKIITDLTGIPPQDTSIIRGSGVNLADYAVLPEPKGVPVVAMASRLLRDKGVYEFVEAARILHDREVMVRFWLIGRPDTANPTSISLQQINEWRNEGLVDCLGYRADIATLYSKAHVLVLPSYREGLPKSLIEAAACGRAVVTTNTPGCRDAIEPNTTGLLVPAQDAVALADAITYLVDNPVVRQSMGVAGRRRAESMFSINTVIDAHMEIYGKLCGNKN